MHLNGLDLNLLVALDALLSERNVTRAAERLNITQPGMSGALHKLRWHFSDQLLERVGRRLEPTPLGIELAGPLKEVILKIRHLTDVQPAFDPPTARRKFRLAMSAFCLEIIGEPLLRRIVAIGQNLSCQIDDLTSTSLSRLTDGEYDLCVVVSPRTLLDPDHVEGSLEEELLFMDSYVLVADQQNGEVHPAMEYESFCRLPYVETRFGGSVGTIVEHSLRAQPVCPNVRMWVPSFAQALSLVSGTALVAAVPSLLAKRHARRLGLKQVPFPFPLPAMSEAAVWHPRSRNDSGNAWLRGQVKQVIIEASDVDRADIL